MSQNRTVKSMVSHRQMNMPGGRSSLPMLLFVVLLLVLVTAGCQAGTSSPATPSIVPARDESRAELSPTATIAVVTETPEATFAPLNAAAEDGPVTNERESESETGTKTKATATPATGLANADVEYVRAVQGSDGAWTFHVTVLHPDTGWEDYADGWDVVTPDGQVLKASASDPFTRLLLHPHESEQPFTRSQGGITIPDAITTVTVRAHDLVDGFGGREIIVDLTVSDGPGFEVERE